VTPLVVTTVLVATVAPALAGATAPPPVALIASPSHVALKGSARAPVTVTNSGTRPVVVDVARAGFALDLRGRPRAVSRRSSWLAVGPRRLTLAPGAAAALTVSAHVPRRAQPGDHSELVLLTSRPPMRRGIPVRLRLGVVVVVRAPGKVVRRVSAVSIRVRPSGKARVLGLLLANLGTVTESVGGPQRALAPPSRPDPGPSAGSRAQHPAAHPRPRRARLPRPAAGATPGDLSTSDARVPSHPLSPIRGQAVT